MEDVLCLLFAHGMQSVCDAITASAEANASAWARFEERESLVAALGVMPLLNRAMRNLARADDRYEAVIWYERVGADCFHKRTRRNVFEGAPTRLVLCSGHTHGTRLTDVQVKKMSTNELCKHVQTLRALVGGMTKIRRNYVVRDVSVALPLRVMVFISQMRGLMKAIKRVRGAQAFRACTACGRTFFKTGSFDITPTDADEGLALYTEFAAGEEPANALQCCTTSCLLNCQCRLERQIGLPSVYHLLEYAEKDGPCGRARVDRALQSAAKRNALASRCLRQSVKHDERPSSQHDLVLAMRARRIRAINVDIGLLYVSAIAAESRSLMANRILAGKTPRWRDRAVFYAKPLKLIGKIYDATHRDKFRVVTNLHIGERFLEKLKSSVRSIL
jgi:hypothetical protein